MDGLIFGMVDNGVLLAGAYLGCDLGERLGKGRGALGAILGAGIGNTVSDALGAALDPAMRSMVLGVALGCLIPLMLVPVIERMRSRSEEEQAPSEDDLAEVMGYEGQDEGEVV